MQNKGIAQAELIPPAPPEDAVARVRERSDAVDALVLRLAAQSLGRWLSQGMAVAAVGGYGRRELFPYSDVDLLLLIDRAETGQAAKAEIGEFLRLLWDAGLAPSHSVHTVASVCEPPENNIELTISTLTRRPLAGCERLHRELGSRFPESLRRNPERSRSLLAALTRERRARFQDTIQWLEPDLKDGCGGLRDLHLPEWLTALDTGELPTDTRSDARDFLFELRYRLHHRAGRNENRLSFDAQEDLFAYPEEAMRRFYRHAREVDWRARLALAELRPSRTKPTLIGALSRRLGWSKAVPPAETVEPVQETQLWSRLWQIGRYGDVLPLAEQAAWMRRTGDLVPPGWRELRELLGLPFAGRALRTMRDTGLLTILLPEWAGIDSLVTRDFYHRYTVDEHTLVAQETLDELASMPPAGSNSQFHDLLRETPDPHLLRWALLFHDMGKGHAEDHARRSTEIARQALERLEAPPGERDTILLLIESHLELSELVRTRDLREPAIVEAVAHRFGTVERLQLLTLLTYADMNAVAPGVLTPWRASQLWSAYTALHRELTRELEAERIESLPSLPAFLQGFPRRYLLVTDERSVAAHAELAQRALAEGAAASVAREEGCWLLSIATRDRPRLFAELAGALASFGMNIVHAEAFGNAAGNVLDVFRFTDPDRRLDLNPEEVEDLERLLVATARGQVDIRKRLSARPLPRWRSRQAGQPVAAFDSEVSPRATLIEISAPDRPGLLYDLASAIADAGCSIDVVLVDTEAYRAIDVFYVTHNGRKLSITLQTTLQAELLSILSRN